MRTNDRSFRGRTGIVAALSVALLVGCSTGLRPFADGTAPPPPATMPPATVSPAPVPDVTPAPAASPLTDGTRKTVSFGVFRKHALGAYRDLKPLKRDMKRAVKASDLGGVREVIADARRWADGELAWANAREARPCFSALYEAWRETVALVREAFVVMEEAIDNMDSAAVERALAIMDEADAIYEPGDAEMAETCRR